MVGPCARHGQRSDCSSAALFAVTEIFLGPLRNHRRKSMSELVNKLASGKHPVEPVVRPQLTPAAFKESVQRGYVHLKFTETIGGTELGVNLDTDGADLQQADFDTGRGQVTLRGSLTLDYVPVKCIAVIELPDLKGHGWLERQSTQ